MSVRNPLASSTSAGVGLLLARLPVGAMLVLTGWRILRRSGLPEFLLDNLQLVMTHIPEGPARTYLNLFPYVCIVLGLTMTLGLLTRASGFLGAALLVSLAYFRAGMVGFINPNPQYAYQLLNAPTVYSLFALVVFFAGPGKLSLDHVISRVMRGRHIKDVNPKYGSDAFNYT
jgi:uncharacterized membrane protein YphA (DoxX/SURF4 family)